MQQSRAYVWEFTPFTLDPQRTLLTMKGEPRQLRRQSFSVLEYLIERRDRPCSAVEIVEAVWARPPAKPDASVTHCIRDIRRALGPDYDWMVKTVSSVGYQFMPPVTKVETAAASPAETADRDAIEGETARSAGATSPVTSPPLEPSGTSPVIPPPDTIESARKMALGILTLMAAVLAILLIQPPWRLPSRPVAPQAASAAMMGPVQPVVERPLTMLATPTLAVVPRATDGPSLENAASFAEQLAAELRRTPKGFHLTIKAPPPDQKGRGDVDTIASTLAVRYVLTVSAAAPASRTVVLQLHESPGNRQVWAQPLNAAADPAEQRILSARMAREIAVRIRTAENRRPLPPVHEAGHYLLQGRVLLEAERDRDTILAAKAKFDQAVEMDPDDIQALLGYARARVISLANRWEGEGETERYTREATKAVDHILSLDKATAGAHLIRGALARVRGDADAAIAAFRHTLTINEHYHLAYAELGRSLIDKQDFKGAIAEIGRAITLSPGDPVMSFWFYWSGMAACLDGKARDCLDWMQRSRQANPKYRATLPWIAIAYDMLDERELARRTMAEHLTDVPTFTVQSWVRLHTRHTPALLPHYRRLAAHLEALASPQP